MILLPLPPSLNNAFTNRSDGRGRRVSKEYARWRREAAQMLTVQRHDMPEQPYGITIRVNIDHRSDIDNRIKPVLDLLVKHGVLSGDQWVNALHVYRDRAVDGCTVEFFDPNVTTIGEAANRVIAGLVVSE